VLERIGKGWNRLRNTSIMIKSPDRMDKRKTNVQFSTQISLVCRSVSIFHPESRKKNVLTPAENEEQEKL
jgi:hypothetical protein